MIADAAAIVAPEPEPVYPEIPEDAWDACADPSRDFCPVCGPGRCEMD